MSEQTNLHILIDLEISHPSIKYRAGIIKHQDLTSVPIKKELKQSESFSEVMMKYNSNSELHRGNSLVSKNMPKIEQQILDLYFLEKTKPSRITSKQSVSRHRVYSVANQIKDITVKFKNHRAWPINHRRNITSLVIDILTDFWEKKQNTHYNVSDAVKYSERRKKLDISQKKLDISHKKLDIDQK